MKTFKNNFQLKFHAIKQLIKSKQFICIEFSETNDALGHIAAHHTTGFTKGQIKSFLDISEIFHNENMKDNLIVKKNIEKAIQLIKA